jgi:ADP-ribose pyrophosphatase YjhB (NUDIX family)
MVDKVKQDAATGGFERRDLTSRSVYTFLGALAVAVIAVAVLLGGLYRAMDAFERAHQPPQSPLVQQTQADTREVARDEITTFPQPRLERNERLEINQFRVQEEQTLNSYGWVDQKAGVVRIPIDRAMQLIAQRGLPTTPKVGSVPASETSVENGQTQRRDGSTLPAAKGKKK